MNEISEINTKNRDREVYKCYKMLKLNTHGAGVELCVFKKKESDSCSTLNSFQLQNDRMKRKQFPL